jgi:predicted nucleic acid-binding protein
MKPIFADTSYFVALCGPNDQFHDRAVEMSAGLTAGLITTEYVLVEIGGLLLRPEDRPAYVNLVRDLESDPSVSIVSASALLFRAGFDLFARRPPQGLVARRLHFVLRHEEAPAEGSFDGGPPFRPSRLSCSPA